MRMRTLLAGLLLAGAATALADAKPDIAITVELDGEPLKDLRSSRAASGLGYAGCLAEIGGRRDMDGTYLDTFLRDPSGLAKTFKSSGAVLVKQWGANEAWRYSMFYQTLKTEADRKAFRAMYPNQSITDPKVLWKWRKDHGIRILLCFEVGGVRTDFLKAQDTDDIGTVKREMVRFVQWIVDNGFKDQVVGIELGNEPYFGDNPERNASRWAQIVPEIKRIFPEVDIGIPIAEYRAGDPDIAAVRARSTAVDKWFEGGSEFGFQRLNQWSGRFIVAFADSLKYCSHVIYHFYGGDAAYGCGAAGFGRIRSFAKVFPEIKDMKVWVTECRERSDEDWRCQMMHSSTLFKACYMMAAISQPEIDAICVHQLAQLSGGFLVANGKGWWLQVDALRRAIPDPDADGQPRIEPGPAGPLFRLYNEALLSHPIILKHGSNDLQGPKCGWSICNQYYGWHHKAVQWRREGVKNQHDFWNAEWIAAVDPQMKSVVLVCCNPREKVWKPTFAVPGCKLGKAKYRMFGCRPDAVFLHQVPGEPPPTWELEKAGPSDALEIPAYTVATVEIPITGGAPKKKGGR